MKNKLIDTMRSKIRIEIIGHTPERFVLRLNKNKINIYKIHRIDSSKVEIIISYKDYEKLLELNTIYEINIIEYLGIVKRKNILLKNCHVLLIFFLCMISIIIFSNIIFDVEIITNDEQIKKELKHTLKQYDISKYQFKKDYKYIQEIKDKILKEYHDSIEWIEIEEIGTKYIVRYEPKIIKEDNLTTELRHIVAKKNAIITKIYSSNGEIKKNKYSYVKKGDIIISGYIYSNDEIVDQVQANGKVYGEVWYETKVVYPFNYYEEKRTGNKKTVYGVKFFNNIVELFNFKPFNDKIVKEVILLKHNILPIAFIKQHQEEIIVTTGMNVVEEIKIKAIALAHEKMKNSLQNDEYIINYHVLDSKIIDKGIEMTLFFSICEDITDYVLIEEMKEVE